jgi:hypothetical protein
VKYTFVVTGVSAYRLRAVPSTNEPVFEPHPPAPLPQAYGPRIGRLRRCGLLGALGEVLRTNLVEELRELLDELLVLLFLFLLEEHARLVQHAFLGEDRHR